MNPFPEDDEALTEFLRRHRSSPPVASPDLEDRIIQSLPKRSRISHSFIMLTAGIAACFVGVIIAQPVRSPSIDAATLEAYMENNWSTVINGSSSDTNSDYLALVESTTN